MHTNNENRYDVSHNEDNNFTIIQNQNHKCNSMRRREKPYEDKKKFMGLLKPNGQLIAMTTTSCCVRARIRRYCVLFNFLDFNKSIISEEPMSFTCCCSYEMLCFCPIKSCQPEIFCFEEDIEAEKQQLQVLENKNNNYDRMISNLIYYICDEDINVGNEFPIVTETRPPVIKCPTLSSIAPREMSYFNDVEMRCYDQDEHLDVRIDAGQPQKPENTDTNLVNRITNNQIKNYNAQLAPINIIKPQHRSNQTDQPQTLFINNLCLLNNQEKIKITHSDEKSKMIKKMVNKYDHYETCSPDRMQSDGPNLNIPKLTTLDAGFMKLPRTEISTNENYTSNNNHRNRDHINSFSTHIKSDPKNLLRITYKSNNTQLQLLQFTILTLITSILVLFTFVPPKNVFVQCTNYYWPLRRLNQHQHHQDHANQAHQLSISGQFVGPPTSLGSTELQAAASSHSANLKHQQLLSAGNNSSIKPPLKRHQLLIGQHYSNFSSDIPYSLIQDSDYGSMIDVAAGQMMDVVDSDPYDQQLDQHHQQHPTSLEQAHASMIMDNNHPPFHQLHTSNAYHQSQVANNQQHQQHQLVDGFPVGIPLSQHDYKQNNQESPLVVVNVPTHLQQSSVIDGNKQQGQQQHQQHHQQTSDSSLRKNDDGHYHLKQQNSNSRALLPFGVGGGGGSSAGGDSNRLMMPQMQQIKARFNQGCVGGTKCQFFAFCWMSGGSLGASCGLLMTCCVTPSRHEIQPGFYGPVVNDQYCGRSTSKINRIVGGTDASFGQFPWQAFVQVGGSRCGGALISSRHVVTAGHCVARSQHSPSSIKVTLGDYILNSDIESIPHEVFSVVEVFLHPNFRFTPQADRYDVAVLELDRQASYKDNIKPICLPQKDAIFVGRVAYVAGWGALQAGSKLRPKVLQHVAVPVIENQVCENWHRRKGIDIRIYDEMMCAGYELGQRDACQGDSGGPLMLNQFGVWYLVGIVSAGYSCAKQYQPGIYHRVSSSSDWISSNVYQQGSNK